MKSVNMANVSTNVPMFLVTTKEKSATRKLGNAHFQIIAKPQFNVLVDSVVIALPVWTDVQIHSADPEQSVTTEFVSLP